MRRILRTTAAPTATRPATAPARARGPALPAALLAAAVLWTPILAGPSAAQTRADPEGASPISAKPLATAERWMIVAANPLASEAGAEALREGASAVDAAIVAQLVLNVVEPQSSGVGGGAFAVLWDAETQAASAWDGRETAPAAATEDLFLGADGAPMGWRDAVATGLSVGTPALPRLLEALHREHGVLPWPRLFAPAIAFAENGFPVSQRLSRSIAQHQERLAASPTAAALFLGADGAPLNEGTLLRQPALAETLRRMAEDGADAFYSGTIAQSIVDAVAAGPTPGALTLEDLAAYRIARRDPVCRDYRAAFVVCGMGPPSSGATTVGQILGVLDNFPIHAMAPEDPAAWHLFAEASRLAYADRAAFLADPDHVSVPTQGLLNDGYLMLRAQAIDPAAASAGRAVAGNPPWREGWTDQAPDPSLGRPGTTHISVVDGRGDAVALTSSIETAFGSTRMAAGFLLNNQLTDFSFRPERDGLPVANRVGPGKRPRSSMAPTIVFEAAEETMRPVLVLGSPGGSRIPEYVAGAIVRSLDWGRPPNLAAAAPHVSQRNGDAAVVEADGASGDRIAAALARFGHAIERRSLTSGLHIIAIDAAGGLAGGADPRREGLAVGD